MKTFKGEVGVQLASHLANQHSTAELVRLAQLAHKRGIDRIWIDDNLRFRNVFVLLAAVASVVPANLGTAIIVPYFRNPIDTADAIATISELTEGRELCIGIARGSTGIVPYQINAEAPISFMRETAVLLKALFAGDTIAISDFPHLMKYYEFKEMAKFNLAFPLGSPIRLYHGCSGRRAAKLAGTLMDGILISGLYVALLRTGRARGVIDAAKEGRCLSSSPNSEFHFGCEINLSISEDRDRALSDPKSFLAHVIPGSYDRLGLIEPLGIDRSKVERMKERLLKGASFEELASLISDEDVKKCFIAGTPSECREQLLELLDETVKLGFDRISFKVGPDYGESIELISREILPELKESGA
ncbi:MAG TPA: LLM class flavin-dependent oxidoreductase [Nitrososphaerales archaeon]|nr:LLM class flavin-dependent oxidoreductase [Nitrososphaerales archaeon]